MTVLGEYIEKRDKYSKESFDDMIYARDCDRSAQINEISELAKLSFGEYVNTDGWVKDCIYTGMMYKEKNCLVNELRSKTLKYPHIHRLYGAYVNKDLNTYSDELKNLFRYYADHSFTYMDLMSKTGAIIYGDRYDVEGIMDFFEGFTTTKTHVDKDFNLSRDSYEEMIFNKYAGVNLVVGELNACNSIGKDSLICVKFLENDGTKSVASIMHEHGHYKLHSRINSKYAESLVSLSMDEAHAFISQFYSNPPIDDKSFSTTKPFKHEKRVFNSPHFYNKHIVVRYKFENIMLNDPTKDPQKVMSELSHKILGHDTSIMQDPHHAHDNIGYFPAYSIGHVIAAQLAEHYSRDRDFKEAGLLRLMSEAQYIKTMSGKSLSTDSFERIWK